MKEALNYCEDLFMREAEYYPFQYELVPVQTVIEEEKKEEPAHQQSESDAIPEPEPTVSKASLIANKLKKKPETSEPAHTKEYEKTEEHVRRPDVESIREKLKRPLKDSEKLPEPEAQPEEEKRSKLDSIRNKLSKKPDTSVVKTNEIEIVEPTLRRKYEYKISEELESLMVTNALQIELLIDLLLDFSKSEELFDQEIPLQLH